ncbi:hypothetical protein DPSP01_001264 [Paraphaeosphaeria sporulosa]|uniref:Uncharacterized protein n=1 Tax=Paraphaeosphaeria sporulosa TaxID=1460663 RepID=A0A177BYL7_9PLEO|nr:uncharacterized protein CC84DRAFT_1263431 [Paraphaeosphaeria sporulosa]OAG00463.1 hypothetical protein CC84DRAFT_1263431 [Paraphaeosphaeria sporulosa]
MGRQAYLTKIALGRSAFEPPQTTASTSECVELASAQQERAHEHGRRLREAQNDVLASIGVVERRRSPSQGLPSSYEERLRALEDEDTAGHSLAITSTLSENLCTWWVGSLRERLLTFRYPHLHSFSSIVASEQALSGKTLIYSGFPSRLLSQLCAQSTVYAAHVLRPVHRLVMQHRSVRIRYVYRRWRSVLNTAFRLSLELLFYPFSYHSYLQRIGLVSARPLLPPLRSFLPFSRQSPLLPFSVNYSALASPMEFLLAFATSPFVFVCLEHLLECWVYAIINAPIQATILRPSNPDMISSEEGNRERTTSILGLRKQSPIIVGDTIARFIRFIGWGNVDVTASQSISISSQAHGLQNSNAIEVGGRRASNVSRLQVPGMLQGRLMETPEGPGTNTVPMSDLNEVLPFSPFPSPPLSPTASQTSHNDSDPRIRITTRGDLVEMEVRLPPQVISSHTEIAGSGPSTPVPRDIASPTPTRSPGLSPYHRVTQLSSEPSAMIGSICKAQIVSLVSLPLKLVTLRLVASHYLTSREEFAGSRSVLGAFVLPSEVNWKSTGVLLSRVALCGTLELAIDLSLWGCQYWTVLWLGTRVFDWGTL